MRLRSVAALGLASLGVAAVASSAAVAAHLGGGGPAAPTGHPGTVLTIRHDVCGCHDLALAGERTTFHLVRLRTGATLTVLNRDYAVQRLIATGGPRVVMRTVAPRPHYGPGVDGASGSGMMAHWRSAVRVSFPGPGVYRFDVREGDHYRPGTALGSDVPLSFAVEVGESGMNHGGDV